MASDFLALPGGSPISSSFNSHFPPTLHTPKRPAETFNTDNSEDPAATIPSSDNKAPILAAHTSTFGMMVASHTVLCDVLL